MLRHHTCKDCDCDDNISFYFPFSLFHSLPFPPPLPLPLPSPSPPSTLPPSLPPSPPPLDVHWFNPISCQSLQSYRRPLLWWQAWALHEPSAWWASPSHLRHCQRGLRLTVENETQSVCADQVGGANLVGVAYWVGVVVTLYVHIHIALSASGHFSFLFVWESGLGKRLYMYTQNVVHVYAMYMYDIVQTLLYYYDHELLYSICQWWEWCR